MRCEYCDCEVTEYPQNGICVHCGGKLPPRPVRQPAPDIPAPQPAPAYRPAPTYPFPPIPGRNCCPKCGSRELLSMRRGFSWGLAILGFFLIPMFGLLLGFAGSKSTRFRCNSCGRKWKPV